MADPGLRHELLVALIKSMPKPMRKNFVPAPNYADALLASISPEQGPLLDEMERQLRRMTGVTVPREAWDWAAVPDHLKLTFRVVDDKHKKVAEGKDLEALKESLRGKVQETLSQVADDDIEQSASPSGALASCPRSTARSAAGSR